MLLLLSGDIESGFIKKADRRAETEIIRPESHSITMASSLFRATGRQVPPLMQHKQSIADEWSITVLCDTSFDCLWKCCGLMVDLQR